MYGNMTNVEKQMNKEELNAWKSYDNNQYSLVPGINAQKRFADRQPSPEGASITAPMSREGPTKKGVTKDEIHQRNIDRMAGYGLSHLQTSGSQARLRNNSSGGPIEGSFKGDPKRYLGAGGLLNNKMTMDQGSRRSPTLEEMFSAHGGQIGAGGVLPDGSITNKPEEFVR